MKRPRIITPCVADRHAMKGERIAEFSTDHGGGLIRVRQSFDGTEVEIYRCDPTVRIITPPDPVRDAAPDMLAALKDEQHEIAQLCDMVNRFAARLGLGRKVNPVDWGEKGRAAIAKAEGRANG